MLTIVVFTFTFLTAIFSLSSSKILSTHNTFHMRQILIRDRGGTRTLMFGFADRWLYLFTHTDTLATLESRDSKARLAG